VATRLGCSERLIQTIEAQPGSRDAIEAVRQSIDPVAVDTLQFLAVHAKSEAVRAQAAIALLRSPLPPVEVEPESQGVQVRVVDRL
jgi:hypothetical protein